MKQRAIPAMALTAFAICLASSPATVAGGDERPLVESVSRRQVERASTALEHRRSILLNVQHKLAERMAASDSQVLALQGILAMLAASTAEDQDLLFPSPWLRRVLEYRWPIARDTEIRDYLKATASEFSKRDDEYVGRWRDVHRTLRGLGDEFSTYDWEARRDHWLEVVAAVLGSRGATDPVAFWSERIERTPEEAELYRFAYVEFVRTSPRRPFSADLLRPLIERPDLEPVEILRRLMLIVSALEQALVPVEDPAAAEFEQRLIECLRESQYSETDAPRVQDPLPLLLGASRPPLRHALIDTLLIREPDVLTAFARAAGVPDRERWQWFLTKHERVDFNGEPLSEAVATLVSHVRLPLWIDRSVYDDQTPVHLKATGTWFEIIERILAQADYRPYVLQPDVIWIGPERASRGAEQLLAAARARTDRSGRLLRPVDLDIADEDAGRALRFFSEAQKLPILRVGPGDRFAERLSGVFKDVPGYLALAVIAHHAGLDYELIEYAAIVGPGELMGDVRTAREAYYRRMIRIERLKRDGNRIASTLQNATEIEFIDQPLSEALEYLSDLHELSFAVAPFEAHRDKAIELTYSGEPLALALTLMLIEPGLTWDTDGILVLVGDPATVARFRRLAAARAERRRACPAQLAAALQRPLELKWDHRPVQNIVQALEEKLGASIRLSGAAGRLGDRRISLELKQVPLDAALDVLSLQLAADWKITDAGDVVIEPLPE